ncbi:MAG: hypothetical protein HY059_09605 [Proteobacteria bacterium]|nr:hypothetical protein [Pseudomonadota bacterium]
MTKEQRVVAVLIGALSAFACLTLYRDAERADRAVTLALVPSEARVTAERSSFPLDDFWERARTIGVTAALVPEETLAAVIERGDAERVPRRELERWRLMGLIAPTVQTKSDLLWFKDAPSARRSAQALRRAGVSVSTQAHGGAWSVAYTGTVDLASVSLGVDPSLLHTLRAKGLIPLPRAIGSADRAVEIRAGAPPAAALKAASGDGARTLLMRLDPGQGVEWNLDRLREAAAALRGADFLLEARAARLPPPEPSDVERWIRYAAAVLLAAFAPLVAVRQGLNALRRMGCTARWPRASPVPELALALGAAAASAVFLGLCAYALLAIPSWREDGLRFPWPAASVALPLLLSAAALYAQDAKAIRDRFTSPVSPKDLTLAAAALLFVCFLACPPQILRAALKAVAARCPELWWLQYRWREVFIGAPALIVGFRRYMTHLERLGDSRDGKTGCDPRPWLLVGLLFPAGTLRVFGVARTPPVQLVAQTLEGALAGALLGLAVLVLLGLVIRPEAAPKSESSR